MLVIVDLTVIYDRIILDKINLKRMGKKNNKSGAQPMSPEKYIKEKARMLPLGVSIQPLFWRFEQ